MVRTLPGALERGKNPQNHMMDKKIKKIPSPKNEQMEVAEAPVEHAVAMPLLHLHNITVVEPPVEDTITVHPTPGTSSELEILAKSPVETDAKDIQHAASAMNRMKLDAKKRDSKYYRERRQRKKEKKIAEGTWQIRKPKPQIQTAQGRNPTETPKRLRSEESTPSTSGVKHIAKKPRVLTPKSDIQKKEAKTMAYSEKAAAIKMAVCPENYPDFGISEDQSINLQRLILERIRPMKSGLFPRFFDCRLEQAALVLACADLETRSWLEEEIKTLGTWEGQSLLCMDARRVINRSKILFRMPQVFNGTKVEKVLANVEQLNAVCTSDWRVLNVNQEEAGSTVVVSITDKDLNILKERQFKLFLGLGRIQVKVLSRKPADQVLKDGSEDTSNQPSA